MLEEEMHASSAASTAVAGAMLLLAAKYAKTVYESTPHADVMMDQPMMDALLPLRQALLRSSAACVMVRLFGLQPRLPAAVEHESCK